MQKLKKGEKGPFVSNSIESISFDTFHRGLAYTNKLISNAISCKPCKNTALSQVTGNLVICPAWIRTQAFVRGLRQRSSVLLIPIFSNWHTVLKNHKYKAFYGELRALAQVRSRCRQHTCNKFATTLSNHLIKCG